MRRLSLVVAILILLIPLMLATACSSTTKISDILANPSQYDGKEVSIKGTVGDQFWLLNKGAYQVGDGSGTKATIWVVTSQPPPQKGTVVSVRGTVEPAITLQNRDLGTVIQESSRS